jgi:hypothetical protein
MSDTLAPSTNIVDPASAGTKLFAEMASRPKSDWPGFSES